MVAQTDPPPRPTAVEEVEVPTEVVVRLRWRRQKGRLLHLKHPKTRPLNLVGITGQPDGRPSVPQARSDYDDSYGCLHGGLGRSPR